MPSTLSRRELIRKFKFFGYIGPYSGRKHQFMIKDKKKIQVTRQPKFGEGIKKEKMRELNQAKKEGIL